MDDHADLHPEVADVAFGIDDHGEDATGDHQSGAAGNQDFCHRHLERPVIAPEEKQPPWDEQHDRGNSSINFSFHK